MTMQLQFLAASGVFLPALVSHCYDVQNVGLSIPVRSLHDVDFQKITTILLTT